MIINAAWKENEPTFFKMKNTPFNQCIMRGTLDSNKFRRYIEQDSLYLIDFAKVLIVAAEKAVSSSDAIKLREFATGAIEEEHRLHQEYISYFPKGAKVEKSLVCAKYTGFLLDISRKFSIAEILMSLLPCFWYYREIGSYIYENSCKNNPYHLWIKTYSGKEFSAITEEFLNIARKNTTHVSKETEQYRLLLDIFKNSVNFELSFWESAYYNRQSFK